MQYCLPVVAVLLWPLPPLCCSVLLVKPGRCMCVVGSDLVFIIYCICNDCTASAQCTASVCCIVYCTCKALRQCMTLDPPPVWWVERTEWLPALCNVMRSVLRGSETDSFTVRINCEVYESGRGLCALVLPMLLCQQPVQARIKCKGSDRFHSW